MELAKRTGLIVIFVIFITGILACFDLYTKLNIKSAVYGYFYSEPDINQINDFEYDITSLLFTNTGTENQYIAKATTKAVSGFDKNKKYTATINNNLCSTTTNTDYINVTFTNQFNSISDSILMTDELNIKINFYTDGTQLIFITNNGEQAVKLWSSYISKNGFKIKIVESDYAGQLKIEGLRKVTYNLKIEEADNTRTVTINDYCQLNSPYTIKTLSDILDFDLTNFTFYGFTTTQSDLDDPLSLIATTGTITPNSDVVMYGLIVHDDVHAKYVKTGTLKINIEFSSALNSEKSYGVISLKYILNGEEQLQTFALKEKTYTLEPLYRDIEYTLTFATTNEVQTISPVTVTFESGKTQIVNIFVAPPFQAPRY